MGIIGNVAMEFRMRKLTLFQKSFEGWKFRKSLKCERCNLLGPTISHIKRKMWQGKPHGGLGIVYHSACVIILPIL